MKNTLALLNQTVKYFQNLGIIDRTCNFQVITFDAAIEYFLENYAKNNCKYSTFRKYRSVLKYHILPFFRDTMLNYITCNDIREFYCFCKSRNFPPRVLKNTLALLNQMIKYFQNLGIIDRTCNFQVRRLSDKTTFTLNGKPVQAKPSGKGRYEVTDEKGNVSYISHDGVKLKPEYVRNNP